METPTQRARAIPSTATIITPISIYYLLMKNLEDSVECLFESVLWIWLYMNLCRTSNVKVFIKDFITRKNNRHCNVWSFTSITNVTNYFTISYNSLCKNNKSKVCILLPRGASGLEAE